MFIETLRTPVGALGEFSMRRKFGTIYGSPLVVAAGTLWMAAFRRTFCDPEWP